MPDFSSGRRGRRRRGHSAGHGAAGFGQADDDRPIGVGQGGDPRGGGRGRCFGGGEG